MKLKWINRKGFLDFFKILNFNTLRNLKFRCCDCYFGKMSLATTSKCNRKISNLNTSKFSEYFCCVKFCGNFKFLFCNEIFLLRAWHVRDAKFVRKDALSVTHFRYQLLWKLRDCVTLSPFKGFLTDISSFGSCG